MTTKITKIKCTWKFAVLCAGMSNPHSVKKRQGVNVRGNLTNELCFRNSSNTEETSSSF